MPEVEVAGIGQEQGSGAPVLLLREREGARRYMAIWVGAVEATAVAVATSSRTPPPRPPTHRLLLDVVEAFGCALSHVRVTALVNDQFHAELVLTTPAGGETRVSARASDAVALAMHRKCRIEADSAVLDEAELPAEVIAGLGGGSGEGDGAAGGSEGGGGAGSGSAAPTDEADIEGEVDSLRRFLADATPEDFRPDDEPGSGPAR